MFSVTFNRACMYTVKHGLFGDPKIFTPRAHTPYPSPSTARLYFHRSEHCVNFACHAAGRETTKLVSTHNTFMYPNNSTNSGSKRSETIFPIRKDCYFPSSMAV